MLWMWLRSPFAVVSVLISATILIATVERAFFKRGPSAADERAAYQVQRQSTLQADQLDAVRTQQREATGLLYEASSEIGQALEQIQVWNQEIVPLRENSAGRAIAEQPELADKMAFLFRDQRPTAEELELVQDRIRMLQDDVGQIAAQSPPTRLSSKDVQEIRALHRQSAAASHDWQQAVRQARAIVRQAGRPPETETPRPNLPLEDTIKELNDQNILKQLEQQQKWKEERAAEEAERRAEEEAAAARLAQAKEEFEEEATSERVKRVLSPFLARRFLQPKLSRWSAQFERTAVEQPMSLSRLEAMGALTDSVEGLKALARVGTSRKLSQPHWDFGSQPHNWSKDEQRLLQEAQEMLRRYGDVLVTYGLLSP